MLKSRIQEPEQENEDFIVQNVTMGPHFVNPAHKDDLSLTFGPLTAIDLTWEEPKKVKMCSGLKNSLRMGYLKRISREQFDIIEEAKSAQARADMLRGQKQNRATSVDIDGREFIADSLNLDRPDQGKGPLVQTHGYANDPLTYAIALDVAQAQAESRGERLSAEEFARRVTADPSIVGRLVNARSMSVSGDMRRGKAFVAAPPGEGGANGVYEIAMTNPNRETYIGGADQSGYSVNDPYYDPNSYQEGAGIAEEIDLNSEVAAKEAGGKGSVRRRGN